MKTKLTATLALAVLALTACGSTSAEENQAAETSSAPVVTSSEATSDATPTAAAADTGYLEIDNSPSVRFEDLPEDVQEGITEARAANAPFYISGKLVAWLKADIPYAERALIEEGLNDGYKVRWVDGFGTGTLTVYLHGETQPVTLTVEQ